jgi:hypothetical protein
VLRPEPTVPLPGREAASELDVELDSESEPDSNHTGAAPGGAAASAGRVGRWGRREGILKEGAKRARGAESRAAWGGSGSESEPEMSAKDASARSEALGAPALPLPLPSPCVEGGRHDPTPTSGGTTELRCMRRR